MKIRALALISILTVLIFLASAVITPGQARKETLAVIHPVGLSQQQTYSISGQVKDTDGKGVQGVLVTARIKLGDIIVKDEQGANVEGAQVFRNGKLIGTTNAQGVLSVSEMAATDELVARKLITEVETERQFHNQDSSKNWAYRIYITSLSPDDNGELQPYIVSDVSSDQTLKVKKSSPLVGFNIVVSTEWNASQTILDELRQGFSSASAYLFDATNGQMLFERVTIQDNKVAWSHVDYRILADNHIIPATQTSSLFYKVISMPRNYSRWTSNATWSHREAFTALIHEFSHLSLGLWDSYFYYWPWDSGYFSYKHTKDVYCTSENNSTPFMSQNYFATAATLMDVEANTSEYAMKGINGLWVDKCNKTAQTQLNSGESDWQTIKRKFTDKNNPARWEIQTPTRVIAGPGNITVSGWSTATIALNYGEENTCPPFQVKVLDEKGNPASEVDVTVKKTYANLYQGKTNLNGEIQILGASPGDILVAKLSMLPFGKTRSSNITCTPGQSSPEESQTMQLQLDAFNVYTTISPGGSASQARLKVEASVDLSGPPQVMLYQDGVETPFSVSLTSDGQGAYTGSADLDTNLPASGSFRVAAQDAQGNAVQNSGLFNLLQVDARQFSMLTSSNSAVELTLPAGALSANSALSIVPTQGCAAMPEDMAVLAGPYALIGQAGLSLTRETPLSMYYLDQVQADRYADDTEAAIYRCQNGQWSAIASTTSASHQMVSAGISVLGIYAALAPWRDITRLYLPMLGRKSGSVAASVEESQLAVAQSYLPELEPLESAITDANGNYFINNLPAGNYRITPSFGVNTFTPASVGKPLPPSQDGVDFTCTSCGSMVFVPAGTFKMGCDENHENCNYYNELPLHEVKLSAYYIDKYEVTNARYRACVLDQSHCPRPFPDWSAKHRNYFDDPTYDNYPVMNLNWEDALRFCEWEGKTLPTEAQWEKAARGSGDTLSYPWGFAPKTCELVNYSGCVGDAEAVDTHPTGISPYGAFNMAGNLREWVFDWYDPSYYTVSPTLDPTGPELGTVKGVRGGGWDDTNYIKVFFRDGDVPNDNGWLAFQIGFRCVKNVE